MTFAGGTNFAKLDGNPQTSRDWSTIGNKNTIMIIMKSNLAVRKIK